MKNILFIFALLCGIISVSAQEVKTLGFSPDVVRPGEQSTYTISIREISPTIDLKQIPIPEGLQFAGSGKEENVSMGFGSGMTRETRLNIYFIPTKEGEFEIKSWQITHNGKMYDIETAKLKADANAPQVISRASQDPFASMMQRRQQPRQTKTIDLNAETKLDFHLDSEKIYIGESVPGIVTFTLGGKILEAGFTPRNLSFPRVKSGDAYNSAGFIAEPNVRQSPLDNSVTFSYNTFITPIKAGEHEIQFEIAGELLGESDFRSASVFSAMSAFAESHPFRISMPAKTISILDLPTPPADFSNAIGNFKIESATIDEPSLSVGTPATLTIKISGEGNFERISPPVLISDGNWKEYKPKLYFEDKSGGFGNKGVKTFEYTIVPNKPDIETAPSAKLVFFDPKETKYITIESEKISVSVAPSKSFARKHKEKDESADTLGELAESSQAATSNDFYNAPWFWLTQIALIGFAVVIVSKKRTKNRLENDPEYARIINAKKTLKICLKNAKQAADKNDAPKFFENSANALRQAICAASNLEAKAVILSDAKNVLLKFENGSELFENAKIYFEGADAILFGGYTPNAGELQILYGKLESICSKIA